MSDTQLRRLETEGGEQTETQTQGTTTSSPGFAREFWSSTSMGAMDAGASGRMAAEQMLRALPTTHITDLAEDLSVASTSDHGENWVTQEVELPKTSLDLLRDDRENLLAPFIPTDHRWEEFAERVCNRQRCGVEAARMTGVSGASPHTRPTPAHVHTTDVSCSRAAAMAATMQFPGRLNPSYSGS